MDSRDLHETETQAHLAPKVPSAVVPTEPILSSWGPFEKLTPIGRGGFGAVYRAWDPRLQREVALKLLRPKAEAAGQGMLLDEARMMARVRHPNVVPVYGVEAHGGRIGFWSELIQGKTLAALIAEQGPMGARECAVAGVEICRALGAVHSAGLLHQDIKAENVMREQGGRILLMDFGLSRLSGQGLTGAGTPVYMAPEMWSGAPASVTTDIYALGVLLYHLTTGGFPFPARSISELREAVSNGKRVPLLDTRPDLPAPLARVIEKACEHDPQRRHHSAGLLGAEISEFLGTPQPAKSSRRWWMIGGAWTAAGAALVGWRVWRGRGHAAPDAPAPEKFIEAQKLIARYDQPGNVDRAIQLLDATIEADPNFALAFSLRAQANAIHYVASRDKKFLDLAMADANQALALNKGLSQVYVTLGTLHLATGNRDVAAQDLQRALSLDASNAAAHRVMGTLLGQQGRQVESLAAFQKAIDLDPDDWQGYQAMGTSLQRRGNNQSAIEFFTQALRKTPDNPLVLTNLGFAQLRAEEFPNAIESLERSVAIAPRYIPYTNLCAALMLEGRYSEAAANCQKAVEIAPENYAAWGDLASAYQWTPDGKETAAKHFRKAIELGEKERARNPRDARVLVKLGAYLATVNEKSRGIVYVRQALALAPSDVEILFQAGEAFEIAGMRREAIQAVGSALQLGFSPTYLDRSPELAQLRNDPRLKRRKSNPQTQH